MRRVHGNHHYHRGPTKPTTTSGEAIISGYQCPQCSAKLSSKHHYQRHLRAHENNVGHFSCDFCEKTFSSRRKFLVHRRNHVGDKKFKCDFCDKAFMQREFLIRHQYVHSTEAPFRCEFCDACFRQRVNLKQHQIRRHPESVKEAAADLHRPHACPEEHCEKRFRTTSELKNHMLYHGDIRRSYSCHFCSSAFVEKRHLDRHIRRVHTGVRNFVCNQCDKSFYEKYELNYHCRRFHRPPCWWSIPYRS